MNHEKTRYVVCETTVNMETMSLCLYSLNTILFGINHEEVKMIDAL